MKQILGKKSTVHWKLLHTESHASRKYIRFSHTFLVHLNRKKSFPENFGSFSQYLGLIMANQLVVPMSSVAKRDAGGALVGGRCVCY